MSVAVVATQSWTHHVGVQVLLFRVVFAEDEQRRSPERAHNTPSAHLADHLKDSHTHILFIYLYRMSGIESIIL